MSRPLAHLLARCSADNPPVLVGNGGCALGRGLGERIDASPCVIRFNAFKIDGFSADYGTRTDVHVVGWEQVRAVSSRCARVYVAHPGRLTGRPKEPVVALWPVSPGKHCTSGLAVATLVLSLLPVVAVVGFAHGAGGHYWERGHQHSPRHDWEFERKVFRAWEKSERVVRL